jgi:imidazolonepropionase-like amidohydrolase
MRTAGVVVLCCVVGCSSGGKARMPPPGPGSGSATPPEVTLRYEIVFADRVAGHAVLVRRGERSIAEDFEFNDRGRGPKTHTQVELGRDGLVDRIEITGVDYYKRSIRELATCDAQRCTWDSNDEHGKGERAYYVPLNGGVASDAPLRALAARPDGVALAGGGVARARKAVETTVVHGSSSVHVTAYELSGFAFTPDVAWYDDDGALFANVSDWLSTIREGWNDVREQLLELQSPLKQQWRERIATQTARRADKIAIVHARLFDPATKRIVDDATILIEGGKVKAVGPKLPAPDGSEKIDARGKTVLPGLWDMHGHVSDSSGLLALANGVTTIRDLGNALEPMTKRKARWDAGTELGPRLLLAGLVDGRGALQAPIGLYADTPAEAKQVVATLADAGYVQLKIYSSVKPELVPVLVAEAHKRGLRVSGHVPAHLNAEDAVKAGFDELQHVNFLMLDVLATRDEDTRTPLRFMRVAERAADLDLDDPRVKALVQLLATKRTVVDPTLGVFEGMFTVRPDHPDPTFAALAARLPPQVRRGLTSGALPVPEGMDAKYRESFKRCMQLVKRLWDRKITIVAGTDGTPGFSLHRELELYVEAGIPAADVLAIATLGAAKVMRVDKRTGSLAPGKDADVVIIDGDPLASISDIRNVLMVVKGDLVIDAVAIQHALSIAPR